MSAARFSSVRTTTSPPPSPRTDLHGAATPEGEPSAFAAGSPPPSSPGLAFATRKKSEILLKIGVQNPADMTTADKGVLAVAKVQAKGAFMRGAMAKHLKPGVDHKVFADSVLVALKMVQNGVNHREGKVSSKMNLKHLSAHDPALVEAILQDHELREALEVMCVHQGVSVSPLDDENYTGTAKELQASFQQIGKMDNSLKAVIRAIFPDHSQNAAAVVKFFRENSLTSKDLSLDMSMNFTNSSVEKFFHETGIKFAYLKHMLSDRFKARFSAENADFGTKKKSTNVVELYKRDFGRRANADDENYFIVDGTSHSFYECVHPQAQTMLRREAAAALAARTYPDETNMVQPAMGTWNPRGPALSLFERNVLTLMVRQTVTTDVFSALKESFSQSDTYLQGVVCKEEYELVRPVGDPVAVKVKLTYTGPKFKLGEVGVEVLLKFDKAQLDALFAASFDKPGTEDGCTSMELVSFDVGINDDGMDFPETDRSFAETAGGAAAAAKDGEE